MKRPIIIAALLCACLTLPASAAIYKCEQDGKQTFQDKPCDAQAKPIVVQPANGSLRAAPARDYDTEARRFEQRQAARDRELEAVQRQRQAFFDLCRAMADAADSQTAWLKSTSRVVRSSAITRIEQLTRDQKEAGC